jgi:integral membrane sensor domain MASE1
MLFHVSFFTLVILLACNLCISHFYSIPCIIPSTSMSSLVVHNDLWSLSFIIIYYYFYYFNMVRNVIKIMNLRNNIKTLDFRN